MHNNFKNNRIVASDLDETMIREHGKYTIENMRELELQRQLYNRAVERGDKFCIFTNQYDTEKIEPIIGFITGNKYNYRNIKVVDSRAGADIYSDYIRIITGNSEDEEELGYDMPQYTTSLEQDNKTEVFHDPKSEDTETQARGREILIINPINPSVGSKSHGEPYSIYGKANILSFLSGHLGIDKQNILFIEDNEVAIEAATEKGLGVYDAVTSDQDFKEILEEILTSEMPLEEQKTLSKEQQQSSTSSASAVSTSVISKESHIKDDNIPDSKCNSLENNIACDPRSYKSFSPFTLNHINNLKPGQIFTTKEGYVFKGNPDGNGGQYIPKGNKRTRTSSSNSTSSTTSINSNHSIAGSASESIGGVLDIVSSSIIPSTLKKERGKPGKKPKKETYYHSSICEANKKPESEDHLCNAKKPQHEEDEYVYTTPDMSNNYSFFPSITYDESRREPELPYVNDFVYDTTVSSTREEETNSTEINNTCTLSGYEYSSSTDYHTGMREDNGDGASRVDLSGVMQDKNNTVVYSMSGTDENNYQVTTIHYEFEPQNNRLR